MPGMRGGLTLVGIAAAVLLAFAMLFHFQLPPVDTVQHGYRGTAMAQIYHPADVATYLAANRVPVSLPPASPAGVKAGAAYKNVQVLGDLSVGQFTRLMVSITNWVAPKQGCGYCHNVANMADDGLYTKVVARRMIQMVQHTNAEYQPHVAQTGVTCYTCHRGNPVPSQIWFHDPGPARATGLAETNVGKNQPSGAVNNSSLPYDPFSPFLEKVTAVGEDGIRVQATSALPAGDRSSIKQTDWTYALMIHFSQSLGVNCTYCHNSRSFGDWSQSSPQRVVAWHGIRMVRDLNTNYLDSLQNVFPAGRLGPEGDVAKVNCATCHQGVYKPLLGVSMLTTFPELRAPLPAYVKPVAAPAPAPSQSPDVPTPPPASESPAGAPPKTDAPTTPL